MFSGNCVRLWKCDLYTNWHTNSEVQVLEMLSNLKAHCTSSFKNVIINEHRLFLGDVICYTAEVVLQNPNMIHHLQGQPAKSVEYLQKKKERSTHLSCMRQSPFLAKGGEYTHRIRKLVDQRFVRTHPTKSIPSQNQSYYHRSSFLTWSSQHGGCQCVEERPTSQGLVRCQAPFWIYSLDY